MVSANDHKSLQYFIDHRFPVTVIPAGQEKHYIKKYAVMLFVATTKPSKALLDWINNQPLYGPLAPTCLLVRGDCMNFEINQNTRIYEY